MNTVHRVLASARVAHWVSRLVVLLLVCVPGSLLADTIIIQPPEDVVKRAPLIVEAVVTDIAYERLRGGAVLR